jgi:hypothetical protein
MLGRGREPRVKPGADGAEQVIVSRALAGIGAFGIAACEILGGEPPPGTGGIEHGEGALLARGEDVVPGKAKAFSSSPPRGQSSTGTRFPRAACHDQRRPAMTPAFFASSHWKRLGIHSEGHHYGDKSNAK